MWKCKPWQTSVKWLAIMLLPIFVIIHNKGLQSADMLLSLTFRDGCFCRLVLIPICFPNLCFSTEDSHLKSSNNKSVLARANVSLTQSFWGMHLSWQNTTAARKILHSSNELSLGILWAELFNIFFGGLCKATQNKIV